MNKQQAIQFTAQSFEDLKRLLPASAQGPYIQAAQQVINLLESLQEPAKDE